MGKSDDSKDVEIRALDNLLSAYSSGEMTGDMGKFVTERKPSGYWKDVSNVLLEVQLLLLSDHFPFFREKHETRHDTV